MSIRFVLGLSVCAVVINACTTTPVPSVPAASLKPETTAQISEAATPQPITAVPSAIPTITPAPTAVPTDLPTVVPTDLPTAVPTEVPTALPTIAPAPIAAAAALNLRTIPTDDGFVTVRAQPTTKSHEVVRLKPGTKVACTGYVRGEAVFGTDQWAECPSVGGFILAALLTDTQVAVPAAPPAAASNDADAIVAAVRREVGNGFDYEVRDICIDGDYATATVAPTAGQADGSAAILHRENSGWTAIYNGPGLIYMFPESLKEFGVPTNLKCPQL